MAHLYDARGNIYAVATPQTLRALGIDLPESAEQAASTRTDWALAAIDALCHWPEGTRPENAKAHCSDGLLIGPFQGTPPFDLLIVNTDGTLAERSGNGLTIFAQALIDNGVHQDKTDFTLRVHHDKQDAPTPVETQIEAAIVEGVSGFWLNLGTPGFGPDAVGAQAIGLSQVELNGHVMRHVQSLARLNPVWAQSVFVRIGNPHCVTLVSSAESLPSFEQLHATDLHTSLTAIAFVGSELSPAGINLQWACMGSSNRIIARVFERGEGPTASSGTSASAVACAAWGAGWVKPGIVEVIMPGGTAPVRLVEEAGLLKQVFLFGTAQRC